MACKCVAAKNRLHEARKYAVARFMLLLLLVCLLPRPFVVVSALVDVQSARAMLSSSSSSSLVVFALVADKKLRERYNAKHTFLLWRSITETEWKAGMKVKYHAYDAVNGEGVQELEREREKDRSNGGEQHHPEADADGSTMPRAATLYSLVISSCVCVCVCIIRGFLLRATVCTISMLEINMVPIVGPPYFFTFLRSHHAGATNGGDPPEKDAKTHITQGGDLDLKH